MTPDELKEARAAAPPLRKVAQTARPLPWSSPEEFHAQEVAGEYVWTPARTEAFLALLADGHSLHRITSQQGPQWPRKRDVSARCAQDPEFAAKVKSARSEGSGEAVDKISEELQGVTSAQAPAAKLRMDFAFRWAAVHDPDRFGQKAQLGVSGGLILASGSLADLAAQAAQMHTNSLEGGTSGTLNALTSPDNLGGKDNA